MFPCDNVKLGWHSLPGDQYSINLSKEMQVLFFFSLYSDVKKSIVKENTRTVLETKSMFPLRIRFNIGHIFNQTALMPRSTAAILLGFSIKLVQKYSILTTPRVKQLRKTFLNLLGIYW